VGIEQTVATPNTAAGYKIPRWKFFASQKGFAGVMVDGRVKVMTMTSLNESHGWRTGF